jgi:precorrin-4 methylase
MPSSEVVSSPEILPPQVQQAYEPRRGTRHANPLSIHLTIHTLDRLVRDLVPFYGEDCPVAVVYDDHGPSGEIFQGTLATIHGWADALSARRPMRVFVG